jgi:hypothetical protein
MTKDLLSRQKPEIIKELRLKINNWISTNEKGEEYLSPEDLKNLFEELKKLTENGLTKLPPVEY